MLGCRRDREVEGNQRWNRDRFQFDLRRPEREEDKSIS